MTPAECEIETSKAIMEMRKHIADHEEVIRQYEFYVWHNMKFFEEKEK